MSDTLRTRSSSHGSVLQVVIPRPGKENGFLRAHTEGRADPASQSLGFPVRHTAGEGALWPGLGQVQIPALALDLQQVTSLL